MIRETKQIYNTNEKFIGWKYNTCTKRPDPSLLIDYVVEFISGNEEIHYGALSESAPWEIIKYWREHAHRCSCCARVADNSVNHEAEKEVLKVALSEGWTEWNPNCGLEQPDLPEGTEVIFMNRDGFISIPYAFDQTRWTWGKDSENDKIAYKIVDKDKADD